MIVSLGCGQLTQQLENINGASMTLVSQPMALKSKLMKITTRWPLALIILGAALTLVWIILLIWFPLRLLEIV